MVIAVDSIRFQLPIAQLPISGGHDLALDLVEGPGGEWEPLGGGGGEQLLEQGGEVGGGGGGRGGGRVAGGGGGGGGRGGEAGGGVERDGVARFGLGEQQVAPQLICGWKRVERVYEIDAEKNGNFTNFVHIFEQ